MKQIWNGITKIMCISFTNTRGPKWPRYQNLRLDMGRMYALQYQNQNDKWLFKKHVTIINVILSYFTQKREECVFYNIILKLIPEKNVSKKKR